MSRGWGRSVQTLLRRRRLASDQRAGSYPRGQARRTQYAFMRRHWLGLCGMLAVTAAILGITSFFLPGGFARGFLVGAGLVGSVGAIWLWIVQATGTAPTMMGEIGEQWTARELRRLRKRGWRLVNHVLLKHDDIDHVVVGPGGVVTVETKWSARPWLVEPMDGRIRDAAGKARSDARSLTHWQDLKRLDVGEVRAAVFLWGEGSRDLPPFADHDGVTIVAGPKAAQWLETLGAGVLSNDQVDAAWRALDAQCGKRDPLEAQSAPIPASLTEAATRVLLALIVVCAGLLSAAALANDHLGWVWQCAGWMAMVSVGAAATRISWARPWAFAWLAGVLPIAALGMVGLLADAVGGASS